MGLTVIPVAPSPNSSDSVEGGQRHANAGSGSPAPSVDLRTQGGPTTSTPQDIRSEGLWILSAAFRIGPRPLF